MSRTFPSPAASAPKSTSPAVLATLAVVALTAVTTVRPALAHADNNVTLQRFGVCTFSDALGKNCKSVSLDETGFRSFARDLSLVMAPRGLATAETPGIAGFVFQVDQSWSGIDSEAGYWKKADLDGKPADTLSTTQIHVRKGLPAGIEVGSILTLLPDSDLMGIGAELKWALHEDYFWPVPDLAIRGAVTSLLGSTQLVLTTVQADVLTGVPIGVSGFMNITPYAGLSFVVPISASKLIDATPADPTPPVDSSDPARRNQPEFAFSSKAELIRQGIAGMRFQVAVVDLTFEGQFSSEVTSYSASLGLDF